MLIFPPVVCSMQACFMHTDEHGFRLVPSSKAGVFRDKTLGLLQKRALMRFFQLLQRKPSPSNDDANNNSNESEESATTKPVDPDAELLQGISTFDELMKKHKLNDLVTPSCF